MRRKKINEVNSKHGFEKRRHQSKRVFDEFVNATNKWSTDLLLDSMFGALEDEELIGYTNMFNDAASAYTKEFERQGKLKESKLNEKVDERTYQGMFADFFNIPWGDLDYIATQYDGLKHLLKDPSQYFEDWFADMGFKTVTTNIIIAYLQEIALDEIINLVFDEESVADALESLGVDQWDLRDEFSQYQNSMDSHIYFENNIGLSDDIVEYIQDVIDEIW